MVRPFRVGVASGLVVVRVTRYCRNRAGGAVTIACRGLVCSSDQSLQVSSGSATLPLRTAMLNAVPSGVSPLQRSAPHLLLILASSTSELLLPPEVNLSC